MTRSTSTWGVVLGAAALVAALFSITGQASAQVITADAQAPLAANQPPLSEDLFASALKSESLLIDPFLTPASHAATLTGATPPPPPRLPINWISGPYFKSGVALMTGDSIIDDADPGYTISGGYRQPLMPALDERLFLDLGGSFLSVHGSRTVVTDAGLTEVILNDVNNPDDDQVVSSPAPDAFQSTLTQLLRGSVHAALGWYWGDPLDSRREDPQWRLATRLGGRVGHLHGEFDDRLVPVLQPRQTYFRQYNTNDTVGGLFVGAEFIILNRDWAGGSVQWTLDAEFANDWVDFKGWDQGTLGTASIMLGVMLAR